MASKVVEICEEKICPIIAELGYEIVEVEYVKKSDGMNLSFYIDHSNGISIDDCEKVSRAISDPLDEVNPTNDEQYILNVCSPGLDRPIKNYKDFLRNKDKLVDVSLYSKVNGQKKYQGILKNYTDTIVEIEVKNELIAFELKDVAQISPVIEF